MEETLEKNIAHIIKTLDLTPAPHGYMSDGPEMSEEYTIIGYLNNFEKDISYNRSLARNDWHRNQKAIENTPNKKQRNMLKNKKILLEAKMKMLESMLSLSISSRPLTKGVDMYTHGFAIIKNNIIVSYDSFTNKKSPYYKFKTFIIGKA